MHITCASQAFVGLVEHKADDIRAMLELSKVGTVRINSDATALIRTCADGINEWEGTLEVLGADTVLIDTSASRKTSISARRRHGAHILQKRLPEDIVLQPQRIRTTINNLRIERFAFPEIFIGVACLGSLTRISSMQLACGMRNLPADLFDLFLVEAEQRTLALQPA